ncbi:MAG TPA: acetate kinase, partial [Candidatus Limnocylindrales bacterium]|nr:acetate kinase [Candidatus Limnocylindrales bacterium]
WGIRRFGFHGLSVAWSVERAAEILSRPVAELNIVVAHLGSGCSVTAVPGGRSAWTSMGFTPLEGLMMGTRSGSIDPGILFHLLRTRKASRDDIEEALEHGSGLAGVSGIGSDIRELEPAAATGNARARLALDMFADRAAAGIAGAMTSVDRVDALVFTAGIGEHAANVRAAIVRRLGAVGVPAIPATETGEDRVLVAGPPAVLRIEAREDLVVARDVETLVAGENG